MKVSLTVQKDDDGKLATLAPVHQLSAHINHYKNWRSNRMYKSVKFRNANPFGAKKIFAPATIFLLLFLSFVMVFNFDQGKKVMKPDLQGKEAWPKHDSGHDAEEQAIPFLSTRNVSESWSGIPALDFCFKAIPF